MCVLSIFGAMHATVGRAEIEEPVCAYLENHSGRWRNFSTAELIAQNYGFGQIIDLQMDLSPYIQISRDAVLGLDHQGHVYQVLNVDGRRIAYMLSGNRKIRDLFLDSKGRLLALDQRGKVLVFSWNKWMFPMPVRNMLTQRILLWAATFCATGAASAVVLALNNPQDLPSFALGLVVGMSAVVPALTTAHNFALDYEYRNENPDGFVETGERLIGYDHAEADGRCGDLIRDYALITKKGEVSLARMAQAIPYQRGQRGFDVEEIHRQVPVAFRSEFYPMRP
jgi:hypothetical protein